MAEAKSGIPRILLIFISGLLFQILLLLIAVTALICIPYRLLVFAITKTFRSDLVGFVCGGANVTFAQGLDTTPATNVCVLLTIDDVVTLQDLRQRFRENIINQFRPDGRRVFEKLQQTTTTFMNYCFYRWVEDFDLNHYVREYDYEQDLALPSECVTEKDLEKVMGRLIALPYPAGRSHWELLCVKNFMCAGSAEKKTVLVLRISHGIADGYSIQSLLVQLSDDPDKVKAMAWEPRGESQWSKMLKMVTLPAKMFWDVGEQIVDLYEAERCDWGIHRTPGVTAEIMTAFTEPIPIEWVKAIKKAHNVSYASVLLIAVSVAISKVMSRGGQRVPNKLQCLFPSPRPNHPGGLTNHVFPSLMAMPILYDSSATSLRRMDSHFKRVINATCPLLIEVASSMVVFSPLCIARYMYSLVDLSTCVGIFPVLSEKMTFAGRLASGCITAVASLHHPGPTAPGAIVSMGGVNSLQRISICMDKSAFPHPEIFAELPRYIEMEIFSMLANVKVEQKLISGSARLNPDVKKRA